MTVSFFLVSKLRRELVAIGSSVCLLAAVLGCSRQGDVPAAGTSLEPPPSERQEKQEELLVVYPPDGAVFPPEIASPVFQWQDGRTDADAWSIRIEFEDGEAPLQAVSADMRWRPPDEQWEEIKRGSREATAQVTIEGHRQSDPQHVLSRGQVSISTSQDEVGAPLFFREVNLPFMTAVKNPAAHIRWRFGTIGSKQPPPIVLDKLPTCGNCHSFSADGSTLAMEVDSGNDKGSYAIAPIEEEITLDRSRLITWSDYRREDNQKTFGLLCQVSPDGRYVAGTVKDRALAVYRPELAFSQLFFLVKGIVAIYDRKTQEFYALSGADDLRYVQTNANWSPDGKTIVFARSRSEAYDPPGLRNEDSVLVPAELANEFIEGGQEFLYDLYRIPFNGGKGGEAEPIEGASNNGKSNYFAKFSPDGKWIVFCKAKSFMLLQPDSELYIVPAAGGEARRLRCNTGRMNSWHSWSPNGRWLVFSSKSRSVYTELFLTHIDEQGFSTPPVVLANFTEPNRAANIPEFVNADADAIQRIHESFLDDSNYLRAGDEFRKQGELDNAIGLYRKALELNPDNARVHTNWGSCLIDQGKLDEARDHVDRAIELDPNLATAHCNLGIIRRADSDVPEATKAYRAAVRLDPDFVIARMHLGTLLLESGQAAEAVEHLTAAVQLDAHDPFAHFNLGIALLQTAQPEQAAVHFEEAIGRDANFLPALVSLALLRATSKADASRDGTQAVQLAERARELSQDNPEVLHALAAAYAEVGRFSDAVATAELAIGVARGTGNEQMAAAIEQALQQYRARKPFRSSF